MSSLEQVKINVTKDSEVITGVKEFEQPQIILNSERIIFNSRVDGIGLFANTNIGILAKEKVVLETPQVIVGSNTATEPQVLGQILFDKISALVDAIGNVTGIPTPTGPTPGPVSAAPTWPNVITARDAIKDALMNGEEQLGVTVHKMIEDVDAGEIIFQEQVSVKDLTIEDIYGLLFSVVEPFVITKALEIMDLEVAKKHKVF